jgi:hypothetical protein
MGPDRNLEPPSETFVFSILSYIIVPRGPEVILLHNMWVWFQIFSEFTGRAWKYQRSKRQKPTSGMERLQVDAIYTMCNIFGILFFLEVSLSIYHAKSKMLSSSWIFTNCTTSFKMNIWAQLDFYILQVINETLRVANLISGVFRRANTDIHFKGILIETIFKFPKL